MCYINHILINTNFTVLQATSALAGLLEEDAIATDESKIIDNAWRGAEVWFCDLVSPFCTKTRIRDCLLYIKKKLRPSFPAQRRGFDKNAACLTTPHLHKILAGLRLGMGAQYI